MARKPPRSAEQRLARWSRSMSPGTLNGKVASASPLAVDLTKLAPRQRQQPLDAARPPIAAGDPGNVTYPATYTDPYTGRTITVTTLPAAGVIAAFGVEGDAFPRVVIMNDPITSGPDAPAVIALGDGTADPLINGGWLATAGFGSAGTIGIESGTTGASVMVGQGSTNVPSVARTNVPLMLGDGTGGWAIMHTGYGDPNTNAIAGEQGDFYFNTHDLTTANMRIYVCTAAGTPGTWLGIV